MTIPETRPQERRWVSHRAAAHAIRWTVRLVPFAVATIAAAVVGSVVPSAPGALWLAGRLVLVAAAATVVMRLVDALVRRALPLAALLDLTLIFPDRAPSRLRMAMRAASSTELARLLERYQSTGADEPAKAAEHLLELVGALSRHDRLTRGHSERVRAYAQMIGEELGLDRDQLDTLRWAALIHDIGKLRIDAAILNKPGKLTREEFAIIKTHPAQGAALAAPLAGWLGDSVLAVAQHHEKWNGSGYPLGLRGEQISLGARIVAVADAFDVITSTRSYQQARSAGEARAELARCAGSHFDPEVVRAFLAVSLGRLRRVIGPLSWFTAWTIAAHPSAPAVVKPATGGSMWQSAAAASGGGSSTAAAVVGAAGGGGLVATAIAGVAAAGFAVTVVAPIDVPPPEVAPPAAVVVEGPPVATIDPMTVDVSTSLLLETSPLELAMLATQTVPSPVEIAPETTVAAAVETIAPETIVPETVAPVPVAPVESTPVPVVPATPAPSVETTVASQPVDTTTTVAAPLPVETTAPPAVDAPCPTTTDWTAEYWPNTNLEGARLVCTAETTVDFDWQYSSPDGVPNEGFSARYTTTVQTLAPAMVITVGSDDGMRLYVDGVLIGDAWTPRTYRTNTFTVPVVPGAHTVVVEYYDRTGRARVSIGIT